MTPLKIENNPNITFHLTLHTTFETSSPHPKVDATLKNWISFVCALIFGFCKQLRKKENMV